MTITDIDTRNDVPDNFPTAGRMEKVEYLKIAEGWTRYLKAEQVVEFCWMEHKKEDIRKVTASAQSSSGPPGESYGFCSCDEGIDSL